MIPSTPQVICTFPLSFLTDPCSCRAQTTILCKNQSFYLLPLRLKKHSNFLYFTSSFEKKSEKNWKENLNVFASKLRLCYDRTILYQIAGLSALLPLLYRKHRLTFLIDRVVIFQTLVLFATSRVLKFGDASKRFFMLAAIGVGVEGGAAACREG